MTTRERYVNTLKYRPVDRIPNMEIGMWGQTRERWLREGMPESVSYLLLAGDSHFRLDGAEGSALNAAGPVPPFQYRVLGDTAEYLTFVDERGRTRRGLKVDGKWTSICMDTYLDFPVKDRATFLEMRKRYEGAPSARYPAEPEWQAFVERSRKGDIPYCINHIWGDFGFYSMLRDWCGTEGISMLFYDDPALVHECLEFLEDYILKLYERALHEARFDYIVIHEDLAGKGGPLIGPELFREFILPHYRRYVRLLKDSGIQVVLVDTDGDFEALIQVFLEVGVDGFTPMEVAAGMDPVSMRRKYGKSFCMMGGVDKREIAKGQPAIDREVARLAPVVAEGGYIPCIDHAIPPDISLAGFEYYLERKRKVFLGE